MSNAILGAPGVTAAILPGSSPRTRLSILKHLWLAEKLVRPLPESSDFELDAFDLGRLLHSELFDVAPEGSVVGKHEDPDDGLAHALMRKAGCFSIVGPAADIGFDEAAVMWAAFYHLMFKENPKSMNVSAIESALTRLTETFKVPMTYIQRSDTSPYWRRIDLRT